MPAVLPSHDKRTIAKPVPLTPIPEHVPDALTTRAQWCLWRYAQVGQRWTKVPYQPNGRKASSTNAATWSSFAAVCDAYRRGGYDGIGYVLTAADGLTGIDIDHCVEHGQPNAQARHWLAHFRSYSELSPSGDGIRIFVRGTLDGLVGRKRGNTECYDRDRFLTITGHRLGAEVTS